MHHCDSLFLAAHTCTIVRRDPAQLLARVELHAHSRRKAPADRRRTKAACADCSRLRSIAAPPSTEKLSRRFKLRLAKCNARRRAAARVILLYFSSVAATVVLILCRVPARSSTAPRAAKLQSYTCQAVVDRVRIHNAKTLADDSLCQVLTSGTRHPR